MSVELTDAVLELLESAAVATVATINPDGSPHLTLAWVGVEDGEIVLGTLDDQRKLRNLRRDPRIALSIQSDRVNAWGLREYLVLEGTAGSPKAAPRRSCSTWHGRTSAPTPSFRRCRTRRPASSRAFGSSGSRGSAPGNSRGAGMPIPDRASDGGRQIAGSQATATDR